MSARAMVRDLRDSGSLESGRPRSGFRRMLAGVVMAAACGAVVYFGAVTAGPALLDAIEKKPAPMRFAKP